MNQLTRAQPREDRPPVRFISANTWVFEGYILRHERDGEHAIECRRIKSIPAAFNCGWRMCRVSPLILFRRTSEFVVGKWNNDGSGWEFPERLS